MSDMKIEFKYQEHDIADVMEYFVKGFQIVEGKHIGVVEYFYDQRKGVVVFKLRIESPDPK